jgi:hypothetical protein
VKRLSVLLLGLVLTVAGCGDKAVLPSDTNATTPTSPQKEAKAPPIQFPSGTIPRGTGSG